MFGYEIDWDVYHQDLGDISPTKYWGHIGEITCKKMELRETNREILGKFRGNRGNIGESMGVNGNEVVEQKNER